jgi:hypothetical protein
MRPRRFAIVLALVVALPLAASAAPPARLSVEGTEFVLYRLDGRVLRSAELVGAELDLGGGRQLRIDAVRRDPTDASGSVLLHQFSQRERGGEWVQACEADGEGQHEGFPVPGRWENGRYRAERGHFALTCTAGAQAKCVRWGYRPWAPAPDGTPMAGMYESCVHMVRADYCGDGTATTRDGTAIDLYDDHGVQRPANEPGFRFEAGWAPHGAVCVNHSRIPQNLSLQDLARSCPRLKAALGKQCDEATARAAGALLFNRSK